MKTKMIVAGLHARPVRTAVTVLAVALEVLLILVVIGLTTGITNETARRTEGVGAEIMVQPADSSVILALSENSMPIAIGDRLRSLRGVKTVAPVQLKMSVQGGIEVIYGIDANFSEMTGGFLWHQGRMFNAPDEIVVDDLWAKAKSAKVGNTVELLNHNFKVTGIVEHGQGARVFISMDGLSALTGQKGRVGVFYVKVKDPDQVQAGIAEVEELLPGYTVRDVKDLESLMTSSNIPGLGAFINAVVIIALCVGILVIFLSMYTTITERTREIGILRSLGASKRFIIGLIFQETVMICILGVVVGTIASFLLQRILKDLFPTLFIEITGWWMVRAAIFALVSGIVGSFYPSLKAARQDPVDAFAYE